MLWVWSTTPQLTEAFVDARSKAEKLLVPITITTYQGLMKALVSATPKLMPVLQKRMHDLIQYLQENAPQWIPRITVREGK